MKEVIATERHQLEVARQIIAEQTREIERLRALIYPQCSICRGYHPSDDRHPCE
jgi:hypothetical protein